MVPRPMYSAWQIRPYRPAWVDKLSRTQALSLSILFTFGLPFLMAATLLFLFSLIATLINNPNLVIFLLLFAFFGLFVKK